METYYPCTWISFLNHKNEKFVNEDYISIVPKLLFFKTTDLYTVYLSLNMQTTQTSST